MSERHDLQLARDRLSDLALEAFHRAWIRRDFGSNRLHGDVGAEFGLCLTSLTISAGIGLSARLNRRLSIDRL